MKIVSLTCPSCGAKLEANSKLKQGICNYCGAPFMIEEEKLQIAPEDLKNAGYEFERGRIDAMNEGADPKLINALGAMLDPIYYLPDLKAKEPVLANQAEMARRKLNSIENESIRITAAAGVAVAGAGMCMLAQSAVPFLLGTLGAVLMYFLFPQFVEAKRGEALRAEERLTACRNDIERYQKALDENDISFVPEKYRNREAMLYFFEALRDKRAVSMSQAINMYEEKNRREEEERRRAEERRREEEARRKHDEMIKQEMMDMRREHMRELEAQREEFERMRREEQVNKQKSDFLGDVATTAIVLGGTALLDKGTRKAVGKAAGAIFKGITGL